MLSNEKGFTLFELVYLLMVAGIFGTVGYVVSHFVLKFW